MAFNVSYILSLKNRYSAQSRKIGADTVKLNRKFKTFQKTLKGVGDRLNNIGSKMSTRVTLPIVAAGVAASVAFGNFEEGLSSVLTLLDGSQTANYAQDLNRVARNSIRAGFASQDATKALFDSVSALGANKAALNAFNEAQKLAIGGSASLSISVDGITSLMNAYGKETTKAGDVATAFFAAQRGGKTDVSLLARNVGKVAPVAKAAGVGFKTLLATMAQLTLGGLSTEAATTGLRGALNALVKPSKEAEQILKAVGIAYNANTLKSIGLVNTLAKLAEIAKKNPNLLAKMIPEVEARTAVAALGGKQIANLRNILAGINRDIANGTGLTDAFAKKNTIFNQSMRRLGGSMTSIGIIVGTIIAPAITKVAAMIGRAATGFEKFAANNPKLSQLAIILAGLLALVGPLAVGIGAVAIGFSLISAPVLITIGAITALGLAFAASLVWADKFAEILPLIKLGLSAILLGVSLIFGPFAVAGAAIGILIAHFEELKNAIGGVASFLGFGDSEISIVSTEKKQINQKVDIKQRQINQNVDIKQRQPNKTVDIAARGARAANGRIDGNININAPKGVVKSVESKTSGLGVNLGLNTASAL